MRGPLERGRPGARRQAGFSVVELAFAAALGGVLAAAGVATLGAGARASRESVGRQVAAREAGRLLESIASELRDAAASSIAFSSGQPEMLSLRRVTGWDEGAAGPRLSPQVTLRAVPVSLSSGTDRLVVVRSEAGRPDARLCALVARADALDPTRPGLWFSVRFEGAATVVDVAVTVDVPCDTPGSAVVRATTSVRVASE